MLPRPWMTPSASVTEDAEALVLVDLVRVQMLSVLHTVCLWLLQTTVFQLVYLTVNCACLTFADQLP